MVPAPGFLLAQKLGGKGSRPEKEAERLPEDQLHDYQERHIFPADPPCAHLPMGAEKIAFAGYYPYEGNKDAIAFMKGGAPVR